MDINAQQRATILQLLTCLSYARSLKEYIEIRSDLTNLGHVKATTYFMSNCDSVREQRVDLSIMDYGSLNFGNRTNN